MSGYAETLTRSAKAGAIALALLLSQWCGGCKAKQEPRQTNTHVAIAVVAPATTETRAPMLEAADHSSPSCMCDPAALKQAVLDRIFDSGIGQGIYNDEQEDHDNPSLPELQDAQRLIDKLHRYADRLTDQCLKDSYTSWISFYQAQHDEGMNNLNHPKAPREDQYEAEQKKKEREVEECKRKGTVPAIPRGMQ